MQLFICGQCGHLLKCSLEAALHFATQHEHKDAYIPQELGGEEGTNCLTCLLEGMVPISEFREIKKRERGER